MPDANCRALDGILLDSTVRYVMGGARDACLATERAGVTSVLCHLHLCKKALGQAWLQQLYANKYGPFSPAFAVRHHNATRWGEFRE